MVRQDHANKWIVQLQKSFIMYCDKPAGPTREDIISALEGTSLCMNEYEIVCVEPLEEGEDPDEYVSEFVN